MRRPAIRFFEKVEIPHADHECWVWTGAKTHGGYGVFRMPGQKSMVRAPRWAYEHFKGAIPEGLEIDHLCRNTSCVNPDHLEAVTHGENVRRGDHNMRRKTHCPQGHAYEGDNLYVDPSGRRHCRTCQREAMRRHRKAR